jgi:hypothetical protein
MITIKIKTLLEQRLEEVGIDANIVIIEQPLDSAVRYKASLDGDIVFSGDGNTPYEAIESYSRNISGNQIEINNPVGKINLTLSIKGDTAVIVVK